MDDVQMAENPLSQDFTIRSLFKFAFPTIIMMLFMGLYTIVDTIFVARLAGTNAMSAFNIVCPVINLIVTAGRPGIGMALGISAGAANILFDYIFMVPLQMGIRGAALGTGMGYLIPTVAGILFFTSGKGSLNFRKPVMDLAVLAESCTNGFSEMVSQSASAVTTFLFNRIMMKLLGEDGAAAITIMIYTQFLLSTLPCVCGF